MYGYIYLTTNKVNGMKYIGQHAKPEFDKYYYGSGNLLTKALNKYGKENFDREILAWAETKEELDQMEIDKYHAVESEEYYNIVPGGGYNPCLFGEDNPMYGKHRSEETRKKISESLKGKMAGENNPNYGNHKLAGVFVGELNPMYGDHRFAGENHPMCIPVVQLTLSGDFVREYAYVKQAIEYVFPTYTAITSVCKGKKSSYKGFKCMYKEDWEKLNAYDEQE